MKIAVFRDLNVQPSLHERGFKEVRTRVSQIERIIGRLKPNLILTGTTDINDLEPEVMKELRKYIGSRDILCIGAQSNFSQGVDTNFFSIFRGEYTEYGPNLNIDYTIDIDGERVSLLLRHSSGKERTNTKSADILFINTGRSSLIEHVFPEERDRDIRPVIDFYREQLKPCALVIQPGGDGRPKVHTMQEHRIAGVSIGLEKVDPIKNYREVAFLYKYNLK